MARSIVFYSVAALIPIAVIATVLGVLLTMNNTTNLKDDDAGFLIADVPRIGRLRGLITNDTTGIFYGIPFSQTTAGEYRWQNPRDPLPVEDDTITVDAFQKPKACPQVCLLPSPEYSCPPTSDMSEDCLNLNVYVPSRLTESTGSHRVLKSDIKSTLSPVLVFIYGGAFMAGGNSIPLYDARFLAEKGDIIVVTLNYRIGPLGFFYQNEGAVNPALGNFGIHDQIKALEWVQRHIYDFGGDPNQVTISGQSAGAQSVAILLLNEHAGTLFQKAIMESNPFGLPYKDLPAAQKIADNFAEFSGCSPNDMECLRGLSMEEILNVSKNLPYSQQANLQHISQIFEAWSPILDGVLLKNDPMILFHEGQDQGKPLIMGYVKDEGALFIESIFSEPIKSQAAYTYSAKIMFKENADAVIEQYPPECPLVGAQATDCDERSVMQDAVTDFMFICSGRQAINSTQRRGKADTQIWWFLFDQLWSFPEFWDMYKMCYDRVCHSADLPYIFDMDKLTEYRFSQEEAALAERMIVYWSNFVKYGDPNGQPETYIEDSIDDQNIKIVAKYASQRNKANSQVYWPKYFEADASDATVTYRGLRFSGAGDEEINDYRNDKCDFFDGIDFYLENYRTAEASYVEHLLDVKQRLTNGEFS